MKKRNVFNSLLVLVLASASAITVASASSKARDHAGRTADLNYPRNVPLEDARKAQGQAIEESQSAERSLGFGGNDSSFFFDYALTGIDDERSGFPGGHTDSFSVGTDVFLPSEILIGLIYTYSETDLKGAAAESYSHTNFFTAYASKSLQPWLTVGATLGVGGTDTKTRTAAGDPFSDVENGIWSTSGFASLLYASGPLFASSTFALQASKVGGSGNWAFTWENNVGYQITDSLTVVGIMRYFQMLDDDNKNNIDDENYTTFGAKLNYGFPAGANLYAGFEFDAWNDSYDTETFVTGYSKPF